MFKLIWLLKFLGTLALTQQGKFIAKSTPSVPSTSLMMATQSFGFNPGLHFGVSIVPVVMRGDVAFAPGVKPDVAFAPTVVFEVLRGVFAFIPTIVFEVLRGVFAFIPTVVFEVMRGEVTVTIVLVAVVRDVFVGVSVAFLQAIA